MGLLNRANLIRVGSILVTLAVWEYVGRNVNPILFTYPLAIAGAFYELVVTGELFGFLWQSLQVLAYGISLALVLGILVGVIVGRFAAAEYAIDLQVSALYSTPTVALVPLIVLWLGFKVPAKTFVVFLFCVFPILINTQQGVRAVDRGLLEVARSFCSTERQLWRDLVIPSALPFIVAGIRLAIGRGLVGMVIAEFYTSITGLGYMIVRYANNFETAKLFVPIVILALMGILLTEAVKQIEVRIAPWRRLREES
jgi:NitT/TauT family transport system permease protein